MPSIACLIASTCLLPIQRKPLSDFARPPPCRLFLACLLQIFPPPPGRGTRRLISVRMERAAIQFACSQSPCPLTHCVRSLSTRCLLANETGDEATNETRNPDEERDERRDEERDGLIERWQVKEKRASCRHPASLPACLVLCPRPGYCAVSPYFPLS